MTPDASFYQFSKEVWQAVNDQARYALSRKEYCPDQSRVESLRCVYFDEESDASFGHQIWIFEANGVDPIGRKHRLYGTLEFSVQYGLLEPVRAALMDDPQQRQRFLFSLTEPPPTNVWAYPSTKVWVRLTIASVVIMISLWLLYLGASMMEL